MSNYYVGNDRKGSRILLGDAVRIYCGVNSQHYIIGVVSPIREDLGEKNGPFVLVVPIRTENGHSHERWRHDSFAIELDKE